MVIDAECGAVGSGFESWRWNAFAAGIRGTPNSRRAASPLVKVTGEERWETPDHSQGVQYQNWGGNEQNRTVTCMVLKAKTNDRCKTLALSRDEFNVP
ncbi:hypothetical protein TNCV_1923841 [Trichonephila clavipes]|nr:hypothetical protein TNCV_1923841 [Trichonephila clavipes]